MPGLDRRVVDAAREELLRYPGVHMVAAGYRIRDGAMTGERVLTAYVWQKRPLAELSERDMLPSEIRGIPVDVLQAGKPQPIVNSDAEQNAAQPPLTEVGFFDHRQWEQIRGGIACEGSGGAGTLGCIARCTDAANAGKLVALTNKHVLASKGSGERSTVFQPEISCCCCGNKIGPVLRTRKTTDGAFVRRNPTTSSIDAGLVLLRPGLQCLAEIQIGATAGSPARVVRGIVPSADLGSLTNVEKRSSRTGMTNGIVLDPHFSRATERGEDPDKGLAYTNQILIVPVLPPNPRNMTVRFAIGGDSGAVVMTPAGDDRVVGLLWAVIVVSLPARNVLVVQGVATDIETVSSQMQITIETATTPGQVITVPATNVPPRAAGVRATPAPAPAVIRGTLERAREEIEATEVGRGYAEIVRRHHDEVRTLIRTNRRVGAMWKRHGGQAILQAALDAVALPDAPIPRAVAQRPLAESVARIAAVFRRYGSAALARDATVYEPLLSALSGRSYNQLLGMLRAGTPLEAMG